MTDRDEARLCADLAAGREDAFDALVEQYGAMLFRAAQTLGHRRADAEDVVQETLVAVVRHRAGLRRVECLAAYLFTILRREAARHFVRAHARRRAEDRHAANRSTASAAVSPCSREDEASHALRNAIRDLPPEQREIVAMKLDLDCTFRQIADTLRISPNTAASRYRYALEKLRKALKESGDVEN